MPGRPPFACPKSRFSLLCSPHGHSCARASPGSCSLNPGTSAGLPAGCGHCRRGRLLLKELLLQEAFPLLPQTSLACHIHGVAAGAWCFTPVPRAGSTGCELRSCNAALAITGSRGSFALMPFCGTCCQHRGASCYKTGTELRFLFSLSLPCDGRPLRSGTLHKG